LAQKGREGKRGATGFESDLSRTQRIVILILEGRGRHSGLPSEKKIASSIESFVRGSLQEPGKGDLRDIAKRKRKKGTEESVGIGEVKIRHTYCSQNGV